MTQELNTQEQEVLQATGKDSPDMDKFRERMHLEYSIQELISVISNLCTQAFFGVQALAELSEEVHTANERLDNIYDVVNGIGCELTTTRSADGRLANNIDALADGFLQIINGYMDLHVDAAVNINDDNLDHLERIADNLSTAEGFSAAESLDRVANKLETISDNMRDDDGKGVGESLSDIKSFVGRVCHPDCDEKVKVIIEGDISGHVY